jgi:hypothetical protein
MTQEEGCAQHGFTCVWERGDIEIKSTLFRLCATVKKAETKKRGPVVLNKYTTSPLQYIYDLIDDSLRRKPNHLCLWIKEVQ